VPAIANGGKDLIATLKKLLRLVTDVLKRLFELGLDLDPVIVSSAFSATRKLGREAEFEVIVEVSKRSSSVSLGGPLKRSPECFDSLVEHRPPSISRKGPVSTQSGTVRCTRASPLAGEPGRHGPGERGSVRRCS
jgi:hypothetical protein